MAFHLRHSRRARLLAALGAAAALALVLAASFGLARRGPAADTRYPAGAAGDSAALARQAYRRCGSEPADDKRACYEGVVAPVAAAGGGRLSMGTLHL